MQFGPSTANRKPAGQTHKPRTKDVTKRESQKQEIKMQNHNHRFTGLLLLVLAVHTLASGNQTRAEESKPARTDGRFPFPVLIDESAGTTRGFPNRVQDHHTGMWYRFVPGGAYQIGSDQLKDSKEIEVELSSFYISETCVSVGQIAQFLIHELKHSMDEKNFAMDQELTEMFKKIKQLPEPQQQDYLLYIQMCNYDLPLSLFWRDFFKITPSLHKDFEKQFASIESDRIGDFKLTPEQRAVFKKVLSSLISHLSKLQSNHTPYGEAYHLRASSYAEYCHADLPTEAQWEAAARLSQAGQLKVKNMLGDHLEWCSDRYAYDYFQRKHGFKDPTGPRRSKLSEKQIDAEVPVSGLKIVTRIFARRLGVLRGETVSTRHYGSYHFLPPPNFRKPNMIRLVVNPASPPDKK